MSADYGASKERVQRREHVVDPFVTARGNELVNGAYALSLPGTLARLILRFINSLVDNPTRDQLTRGGITWRIGDIFLGSRFCRAKWQWYLLDWHRREAQSRNRKLLVMAVYHRLAKT